MTPFSPQKVAKRMTAKVIRWAAGCLVMLISVSVQCNESEFKDLPRLDKLKAAYLFNFTKFIHWPNLDRQTNRQSVVICLSENEPVRDFLQALVQNRKVGEQKLMVEVKTLAANTRCDLAYLSAASNPALAQLEEVLLVSSDTDLFQNIATFSFYEEGKRLRFIINMQRLNELELKVSSELLKLARINE